MIKFIVGLKNPGSEYAKTRHNAGAWFIDELAHKYSLNFKLEKKFHLEVAELSIGNSRLFIAKPITYMNESGIAIGGFAKFFQIQANEILVAHDELDFAPGIVRLKEGGGHGGHNGLRDIFSRLGSQDFYRLRIGIGHPGDRNKVVGYVLQAPTINEKIEIEHAIDRAIAVMPEIWTNNMPRAIQALNSEPQ